MRIAQVGPGIMPIPPDGWGAVEMLIWDYYQILSKQGHDVEIINTPDRNKIVDAIWAGDFDAVHIHYDVFHDIFKQIDHPCLIVSSHYPFLNTPQMWSRDNYHAVMRTYSNNKNFHILASSKKDINTFVTCGADPERVFMSRLGVRPEPYAFHDEPRYDKTLCFSQITDRKRQYLIQDYEDVDFMGRLEYGRFKNHQNYFGEVPREFLNHEITKYSNFTLLSEVENTTPLVVKEALICGLGVVVSESVAVELDEQPFIRVIPERLINNDKYIRNALKDNREASRKYRKEIREYGIQKFGLENILANEYIPTIEKLLA